MGRSTFDWPCLVGLTDSPSAAHACRLDEHAALTAFEPYACEPDPNRSEPLREGRASVCNWAVEHRFDPRDICGLAILTLER